MFSGKGSGCVVLSCVVLCCVVLCCVVLCCVASTYHRYYNYIYCLNLLLVSDSPQLTVCFVFRIVWVCCVVNSDREQSGQL